MSEKILLGAGILFVSYGAAVKLAGTVTKFYLVWFAGAALCFTAALFLRPEMRQHFPVPAPLRIALYALLAIFAVLFVFVMALIGGHFGDRGRPGLDYLIVPGAQVFPDGPSNTLRYRLDRAYDYLAENPDTLCIVSGGKGENEPEAEGSAMERYLLERGILADRILTETESKTTAENLRLSRQLMRDDGCSAGIVTNNFHVFRALKEAKRQGLPDVCGIAAGANPVFLPNNLLREFFAVLRYGFFLPEK